MRPVRECGCGPGLLEVSRRSGFCRCRGAHGVGPAGRSVRLTEVRSRGARAHIRSGSGDAQPLHAGRHDRQQLLRRTFGDGRQDSGEHRSPRGSHLRWRQILGGTHFGGGTRDDHRQGRQAGRDLRKAQGIARKICGPHPREISEDQATRLGLQPRPVVAGKRLQRGARPRRQRRHLRGHAAGGREARYEPRCARPADPWFSGHLCGRRQRSRGAGIRADSVRRARLQDHRRPARAAPEARRYRAPARR